MNAIMNYLNQFVPVLQTLLAISAIVGALFVARNAKKAGIIQIQDQTIEALQQQINAIKDKQDSLSRENEHLRYIIETISKSLKQKGILITIDGEMVTLTDAHGSSSSSSRRKTSTTTIKKTEEKDV